MNSLQGDRTSLSWSCSLLERDKDPSLDHPSPGWSLRQGGLEVDAGIGVGAEWLQGIECQKSCSQSELGPVTPFRTLRTVCYRLAFSPSCEEEPDSGNISCMIKPGRGRATVDPWAPSSSMCSGRVSEVSTRSCRVGDWLLEWGSSWPLQRLPVDSQSQSERSDASLIRGVLTHRLPAPKQGHYSLPRPSEG